MNIDLIPMTDFIKVNNLREVTNPIIFDRGNVPTEDGLLSTEIFGINATERKSRFAYIDLKCHFFHPVIYKSLLRMDRNIQYIVQGVKNYIIDDKGRLVEDEEKGNTGIDFLYKNWDKLKFARNESGLRNERIDLLESFKKDVIFCSYWIVIPAFYRDVDLNSAGDGKPSVHTITKSYSNLIRYASIIEKSDGFAMMINMTKFNMQQLICDIYDMFKAMVEKKHGLIKKSLMGKSVDYGVRSVISAPTINYNSYKDMVVDSTKTGIPLYQCCSLLTPFIVHWVKNFFRREFESTGSRYPIMVKGQIEYVKVKNPETYFNEEYINKAIDRFVHSPFNRFDTIEIPVEDPKYQGKVFMRFAGRQFQQGVPETESPLINRNATWTDILYRAAVDVTQDKYAYITRYPLTDITSGIFISGISVLSTVQTTAMFIGDKVYKDYPLINLDTPQHKIPTLFRDTVTMSNVYLAALGGDYDGDQITIKIPFTQEANLEAKKKLYDKTQLLSSYGKAFRSTTNEMVQTLYMLTKTEKG